MVNGAVALAALPRSAQPDAGRALHERLICLDTHLDTPASLARPGWDIMQRHSWTEDFTQVDYPRMAEGGLDGGFFAIYTPQGPRTPEGQICRNATPPCCAPRKSARWSPPIPTSSNWPSWLRKMQPGSQRRASKRIVYQSIENSYPLGDDITLLRSFYKLGVRMVGFIHFKTNQFGDSATDKPQWNGLSPAGHELAALANDLGMVLDASHSADSVFDNMLEISRSPIILSHSGCRAVHNNPRNIDDDPHQEAGESRRAASRSTATMPI